MSESPVRFDSELRKLIKDRLPACTDEELASYTSYLVNYIAYLEGKLKAEREKRQRAENSLRDIAAIG